ncbi:hypothetical protein BTVI_131719 [Pitangus sulphuratus]|nr:hypothetical protein BTVI_131719 [Pitangus sulphuratus]
MPCQAPILNPRIAFIAFIFGRITQWHPIIIQRQLSLQAEGSWVSLVPIMEYIMGDGVKGFAEVQIDHIRSLPLIYQVGHLIIKGDQGHDLGNTGTNAVTRSYSTKRQKTEQPEGQLQSPVLQGDVIPKTEEDMARGQQKIQSQQKNAKKQAEQKKKQGHDQKAAAKAALIYTCTVCRTQMPDPKTFKQHFESKHPKTPLPPELADVQA